MTKNNYTITKTSEQTIITLPAQKTYTNHLNNTKYYTSRREQKIRTHIDSWKTIATLYLDNITLSTPTITDDTTFTFTLRNDQTNTMIEIPISDNLSTFGAQIAENITPKHFYIVDLDNTDKFNTHILDFINTVLVDLYTNKEVLNEVITETPEEPTTNPTEEPTTNPTEEPTTPIYSEYEETAPEGIIELLRALRAGYIEQSTDVNNIGDTIEFTINAEGNPNTEIINTLIGDTRLCPVIDNIHYASQYTLTSDITVEQFMEDLQSGITFTVQATKTGTNNINLAIQYDISQNTYETYYLL